MINDKQSFRDAMALLGSAVNVITTNGPGGKCGYTGTAACSVTDSPGTLLVCLNKNSEMNPVFRENGVLCVNVLNGAQSEVSRQFAGVGDVAMADRFNSGDWTELQTGSPMNTSALCALDCKITHLHDYGTHSVFFAEVQEIHFGSSDVGLVYWAREYHQLKMRGLAA